MAVPVLSKPMPLESEAGAGNKKGVVIVVFALTRISVEVASIGSSNGSDSHIVFNIAL